MTRILGVLLVFLAISISDASIFHPISDSHRSAAQQIFAPVDGSFASLEEAYQALRSFEILGIEKGLDLSSVICTQVSESVQPSYGLKDVFYALKCNQILDCKIDAENLKGVTSRLQAAISDANSLSDYYYTIGSLLSIKKAVGLNVKLSDANNIFRSIKSLGQSDGRWHYSSNNPKTSTHAAGMALETLAGVVSLAETDVDQSLIDSIKNDIGKIFDNIKKYDDGAMYFDEKAIGEQEYYGPLHTTSSVLQGVMAFADASSGNLNVARENIIGLAKFFLGVGVPGNTQDFFNQINSLAWLEHNQLSIPLILSVPATVLSLTEKDVLKVKVNTVLGSSAPPLQVKVLKATVSSAKSPIIEDKELKFDTSNSLHVLDDFFQNADVGIYSFVFKIVFNEPDQSSIYAIGETQTLIYVTGAIKVDSSEITVLDSDLGSEETRKTLDLASEHSVSLSANHLQKLRLSFQLSTPLGNSFKPHQAILKLRHESKFEHLFVVPNSGKQFEITLDFLGLVEKLYYLSGKYDIELSVGDALMENSFLWSIGYVDLELPEAPEKATRPPPTPVDPYSRYGPKAEISHIFRSPEKLPPKNLSYIFLGLVLLPLVGFFIGLLRLGVNFKNFPSSGMPAIFAILFHVGIAAVLGLYALFWLKLDLFVTLKTLGFLGVFLVFVGHRILSHLASSSAKTKSA